VRLRRHVFPAGSTGIQAQATRFVLTGATVAVFYVASTTFLNKVAATPFQVALAVGFLAAIALHFTLQRFFVWAQEAPFTLTLHRQLGRYLAMATLQYLVTAAATATLPSLFAASTFKVYLVTTAVVSVSTFLIFRSNVFHTNDAVAGADDGDTRPSAVAP
jgi:putative flippase GtrA